MWIRSVFAWVVRGRPELGPPTDRGGNVTVAWTAAPALFLSGQGNLGLRRDPDSLSLHASRHASKGSSGANLLMERRIQVRPPPALVFPEWKATSCAVLNIAAAQLEHMIRAIRRVLCSTNSLPSTARRSSGGAGRRWPEVGSTAHRSGDRSRRPGVPGSTRGRAAPSA